MGEFIDTIVCWIRWVAQSSASYVLDVFEFMLEVLVQTINVIASVLPGTGAEEPTAIDGGILGTVNYFVPISTMLSQFSLLMTAWIAYRVYQWLLAMGKADY